MSSRSILWCFAGIAAALLHAAAAAAVLLSAEPPSNENDDGAAAIEVGIELAAPLEEQTNLPLGSPADDAAASTASAAREVVPEKVEDLPQEKPVDSAEPDRAVAPEPQKEEKKSDETLSAERSEQSQESMASTAASAPDVEAAKEASISTAPTPGAGKSVQRVRTTWQRQLVRHLNRNKRYPAGAGRREAEILVSFSIDRTGKLLDASVAQSSGDTRFDEAALAMLRRADPLPMPPPVVADDGLVFTLPVNFKLAEMR
jgi:periplasmic protein TonB